jgi:uncharacterized protein (DUF1697 family)
MPRHIALLRGINLGGQRRVPMARLRALLEAAGHRDVRTLLQSGNIVLTASAPPATLERSLSELVSEEFGFSVSVVVRTRDELAGVVARDPFGDAADDPRRYQVSFLGAEPAPEAVAALEGADVAPERVVVSGREVYAWHPDGLQRSQLARLISADRLGVEVTARNWATVGKLLALADE